MMNFKFRAYDEVNDMFIYFEPDYVHTDFWHQVRCHQYPLDIAINVLDKNDTAIFTGDIVVNSKGIKGEVKYIPELCAFVVRAVEPKHVYFDIEQDGKLTTVEVIGNIYQNKDDTFYYKNGDR